MKRRQVTAASGNSPTTVARAQARTVALFAVAFAATAVLPPGASAAIDPAERPSMARAVAGHQFAQTPPGQPAPALVPPVNREPPAAAPPATPSDAPPPAAEEPVPAPAVAPAPSPQTASPKPATPPPASGGLWGTVQDWLARSNRDYQGVVIKELALPTAGQRPDDAIAKKLEETKADDAARKAADAKRREDEKKLAAQKEAEAKAKQLAEEVRRKKEAAAAATAAAAVKPAPAPKSDDAAKIAEELRRTEQQQQDEARRREAQKQAEAKAADARRADDERKRTEAAAALAADERRRAEEAAQIRDRRRTIVLSVEPIRRPDAAGTMYRPELASPAARERMRVAEGSSDDGDVYSGAARTRRHVRLYRTGYAHRGTAVKRWVYRSGGRGCRTAGRVHRPPSRYTVARGDSLWRISDRHYSSGQKWGRIYRANRHRISDPDLIYPCQRFKVPRR